MHNSTYLIYDTVTIEIMGLTIAMMILGLYLVVKPQVQRIRDRRSEQRFSRLFS